MPKICKSLSTFFIWYLKFIRLVTPFFIRSFGFFFRKKKEKKSDNLLSDLINHIYEAFQLCRFVVFVANFFLLLFSYKYHSFNHFLVLIDVDCNSSSFFLILFTVFPNVPSAPGMSCVGEDRKYTKKLYFYTYNCIDTVYFWFRNSLYRLHTKCLPTRV